MNSAQPTRLRFGSFEADLALQELYENGEKVPMQSKPFQFLATLLRRHGEIVSREAISHSLWPDIYVQVNQGLNAAARKVRKVLRDDATKPKFVETLGSRGYRFIHAAEVLRWSSDISQVTNNSIRLAVVPIKTDGDSKRVLAGGLTAELISQLGRLHPRLIVICGRKLSDAEESEVPSESACHLRKLDVEYALTGRLSGQEEKIDARFSLVNSVGETIWAQEFLGVNDSWQRLLAEISTQVASSFDSLPKDIAQATPHQTSRLTYQRYLQGRNGLSAGSQSGLRDAIADFKKVIERDLQFESACTALAEAYNLAGDSGTMHPLTAYRLASQAGKRALSLDPNSPEAMVAVGWSEFAGQRDWATGTRLFERALELNPNLLPAHCYYAYLLLSRDRTEDGVASLKRASQIDSNSLTVSNSLANAYYYVRCFDEGIKQARYSLELEPKCSEAWSCIGYCNIALRRCNAALDAFRNAAEHSEGNPAITAQVAYAEACAGHFPEAESLLRLIETRDPQSAVPAYHIGLAWLALGNANEAFRWFDLANQQRSHWILLISLDPRLDIMRGTKNFDFLHRSLRPAEARRIANPAS